jgi:hypothetical protein
MIIENDRPQSSKRGYVRLRPSTPGERISEFLWIVIGIPLSLAIFGLQVWGYVVPLFR